MKITAFHQDEVLNDFLTDYLDNNLHKGERDSFEEYLDQNEREKDFSIRASQGKKALEYLREELKDLEKTKITAEKAIY